MSGSIPEAPGAMPILGHALPLIRDPLGFLRSLPLYGKLVQVRLGTYRVAVVCDAELTHQVLVNDRVFDKGGVYIEKVRETVGNGLGTCAHADHRRQRRLLRPAFQRSRVEGYAAIMSEQIEKVLSGWEDGLVIDALAEMQDISARAILATAFSTSLDTAAITRATKDFATISSGLYRRMFLPGFVNRLPTPWNRRYARANGRLREIVLSCVADHRAGGADFGDLLSILMSSRDQESDGAGFADTELVDQAMTFFFAGIETTSTALAWALHQIASDPGLQRRLREEIDGVLGGRSADYADLARLPLTLNVLTETLRTRSPAWLITRTVTTDTVLGKNLLPAGSTLAYSPFLIHHRPDLHPDPERFDPDRWSATDRGLADRHATIPFGGGARTCIGDHYGTTQASLVLAAVIAKWELHTMPGTRAEPVLRATLQPRSLRLRVTRRAAEQHSTGPMDTARTG